MKCLLVGWEPGFAEYVFDEAITSSGFSFTVVRVDPPGVGTVFGTGTGRFKIREIWPQSRVKPSKADDAFLAKLEAEGVPTLRRMVQGDPFLRHLDWHEAKAYAAFLGKSITKILEEERPDLVIASFDRIFSGLALACARQRQVPFIALNFPTIPYGRIGFSKSLVPDTLVPLSDCDVEGIREQAAEVMRQLSDRRLKVPAYRAPGSTLRLILDKRHAVTDFPKRAGFFPKRQFARYSQPPLRHWLDMTKGGEAHKVINSWRLGSYPFYVSRPSTPYVLHVLQMSPESYVDTWATEFQDQMSLVRQLSLAIPADHTLVVKPHFSDPYQHSPGVLRALRKIGVEVAHPRADTLDLIQGSAVVSGITSSACTEAFLLGRPVMLFGPSRLALLPNVERAGPPAEWSSQIRGLVRSTTPSAAQIEAAFAGWISAYLPGFGNDWSRPITSIERASFAGSLERLRQFLDEPDTRKDWYKTAPFVDRS